MRFTTILKFLALATFLGAGTLTWRPAISSAPSPGIHPKEPPSHRVLHSIPQGVNERINHYTSVIRHRHPLDERARNFNGQSKSLPSTGLDRKSVV